MWRIKIVRDKRESVPGVKGVEFGTRFRGLKGMVGNDSHIDNGSVSDCFVFAGNYAEDGA